MPVTYQEAQPNAAVRLVNQVDYPINTPPREKIVVEPGNFIEAAKRVMPCVVNITAKSITDYRGGTGSGVVISEDGYIVTNHHVVANVDQLDVQLDDKRTYEAKVIGMDPSTDLALIKIEHSGMIPIEFGNSDEVEIGEWVLAVGNPFSLTSTVTAGIISSKARNINILRGEYAIESFLQTDAVVNPGNSGGALVNIKGELVGLNTAIITESGNYEGYSFAIPSNLVKKVINDLKDYGEVKRAVLGVFIRDVTDKVADDLALPKVEGVIITGIGEGSSAELAGLKIGDVILKVNNVITNTVPELQEQVALFRPGAFISIEFMRDGKKFLKERVELKAIGDSFSEKKY